MIEKAISESVDVNNLVNKEEYLIETYSTTSNQIIIFVSSFILILSIVLIIIFVIYPLIKSKMTPSSSPGTKQPATQQPATQQPATQQPATQQPVTQQPVTQQPVTQQPKQNCLINHKVAKGVCVECEKGTNSSVLVSIPGNDTSCDPIKCGVDFKVDEYKCVPCPPGTKSPNIKFATNGNTTCDPIFCNLDERVLGNKCVPCPPGTTSKVVHDASGGNTTCDPILCKIGERVLGNKCVPCPQGTTSKGNDNASGGNTICTNENSVCGVNQYVSSKLECTACPPGKTALGGNKVSDGVTTCISTLCGFNQYVSDHRCLNCSGGSLSDFGSDASGEDTACFYRKSFFETSELLSLYLKTPNTAKVLQYYDSTKNSTEKLILPVGKYTNFIVSYKLISNSTLENGTYVNIEIGIRDKLGNVKTKRTKSIPMSDARAGKLQSSWITNNPQVYIDGNGGDEAYIKCNSTNFDYSFDIKEGDISLNNYPKDQSYYVSTFLGFHSYQKCPAGSYCVGLNRYQCPPQTSSPEEGATVQSQCNPIDIYGFYGITNGATPFIDLGVKKYQYTDMTGPNTVTPIDFTEALSDTGQSIGSDNRQLYLGWDIDGLSYIKTEKQTSTNTIENFYERICRNDNNCSGVIKSTDGNLYAVDIDDYTPYNFMYSTSGTNRSSRYKYENAGSVILTKAV